MIDSLSKRIFMFTLLFFTNSCGATKKQDESFSSSEEENEIESTPLAAVIQGSGQVIAGKIAPASRVAPRAESPIANIGAPLEHQMILVAKDEPNVVPAENNPITDKNIESDIKNDNNVFNNAEKDTEIEEKPNERVVNKLGMNILDVSLISSPSAFPLDATALRAVYLPIFGTTPRSSARAVGSEFFSPSESRTLGEQIAANKASAPSQFEQLSSADFSYIVTLRSFLGNACAKIVAAEITTGTGKIIAGPQTPPSAVQVSALMTLFFGYAPLSGKLHIGAQQYADLFKSEMDAVSGQSNQIKNIVFTENAVLMCVSIGSDTRTIFR